jgi:hypothetical protein
LLFCKTPVRLTSRYLPGHGKFHADLNKAKQGLEEWVIPIGAVKTTVAIGPGHDKSDCVELSQLVLDGVKGEAAHFH